MKIVERLMSEAARKTLKSRCAAHRIQAAKEQLESQRRRKLEQKTRRDSGRAADR